MQAGFDYEGNFAPFWKLSYVFLSSKSVEVLRIPAGPEEPKPDSDEPVICCEALTAKCFACKAGLSVEEFCKKKPKPDGCSDPKDDSIEQS